MEVNNVTNILLTNKENCALKVVDEIILYYDVRSKIYQIVCNPCGCNSFRIFVALCCNKLQRCSISFLPCCATVYIEGTGPKIRFWE